MKYPTSLDTPEKSKPEVTGLLHRMSRGDREAFRKIYHLYAGELNKYIFLFTRSTEDTEDILQEIFVKLWEKRQTLTNITSFRGYLYQMTRNHTFNYFRKSKKLRTVDLSEREEEQFSGADAADQLLYKQYHTQIGRASCREQGCQYVKNP